MKKFLFFFMVLAVVLNFSKSLAAERIIEASGNYIMDSRLDETPASATARAREEAKRFAIEKAGVFLQSYSKMVDLELDTDEVKTVAARLLKIQSEKSDIEILEKNLLKFTVTIEALVDDIDENILKNLMNDKTELEKLTKQNKELQKKYDELTAQMEKFKNDYENADEDQKIKIKSEVARNSQKFYAIDELNAGKNFAFNKNWTQALNSYDKAINYDPSFAEAYNNRGVVKYEIGKFFEAIEDYSSAINLRKNYVDALNNRGNAYAALNQLKNAENDFKNALNFEDNAIAHNNLGNIYFLQKNFDAAVDEYTRSIKINPKNFDVWYNRAAVFYAQGKFSDALSDINQAKNLNSYDENVKNLYEKISAKVNK